MQPWERLKKSFILNLLLFILVFVLGYYAYDALKQAAGLSAEKKANDAKIQKLAAENEKLRAQIQELGTTETAEKEAKERLNLKLPGEEVAVVVPEAQTSSPEKTSFFAGIKKIFFSLISLIGL